MTEPLFRVELPVRNAWEDIEATRTAVVCALLGVYENGEACELIGMVVSELLENALKYGEWELPVTGAVEALGDRHEVVVRVVQPLGEGGGRFDALVRILDAIRAAPSAEDAYIQRMREVAQNPGRMGGLGLARVAYEARCDISAERIDAQKVCVRAVARAPGPPRADAAHSAAS